MTLIRAIYHDGQLQLLDAVDLREGQEVRLQIISDERKRVFESLSELLTTSTAAELVDVDEIALQSEIDKATQTVTLSDLIIEERNTDR